MNNTLSIAFGLTASFAFGFGVAVYLTPEPSCIETPSVTEPSCTLEKLEDMENMNLMYDCIHAGYYPAQICPEVTRGMISEVECSDLIDVALEEQKKLLINP